MIMQPDQWARCAHEGTSLLPGGGVELSWVDDDVDSCAVPPSPRVSGLAFDQWCQGYRTRPAAGAVDVFAAGRDQVPSPCPGVFGYPTGLAIDGQHRLYIAEPSTHDILVVDLQSRRVVRRVPTGIGRAVDVARDCGRIIALIRDPDALVFLEGRRGPRPGPSLSRPNCSKLLEPTRVTSGPLVLWTGAGQGLVARPDGTMEVTVDGASDIETTADGVLVVGRCPGLPFRRFQRQLNGWLELEPVGAPGYDGGAIAIRPDGRIAYSTNTGFSTTTGSAAQHGTEGKVVTYRLDSGVYGTRWGRLFLDTCLPPNTSVAVRFLTSDIDEVLDPIDAPAPTRGGYRVPNPDATPSLPSKTLLSTSPPPSAFFKRPNGREGSWSQAGGEERFETYESPVVAPPGRYLWLDLRLSGTVQVSPRIRALRVERPGHKLLNSLPKSWSRDAGDVDFLHRFLSPIEGTLHELDWRAAERAILLDPRSTPAETLPWLASFAGLVLDRRWSEESRRTLVAEAYDLFNFRGTRYALERILEIYLGHPPAIVERWRLRGLGGTVLGTSPQGPPAPVVGGAARTTGTLGRFTVGGRRPDEDSYRGFAHRFTVLIPGKLTPEQSDVVEGIVAVHSPAHTMCEVCELGTGMRIGERLRVAVTSYVGPGAGWTPIALFQTRVGEDGLVGAAGAGSRVGDAHVGRVRVG